MPYVEARLWLDAQDAERDERIGEHEAYLTLFDLANNRYLGNRLWWTEALESFERQDAGDREWLRDILTNRLRVVPRCHCDQVWCPGEEWAGSQRVIAVDQFGMVRYEDTETAALSEWRAHVDQLRAAVNERLAQAAKRRAGGWLVSVDELGKMEPAERHGAIRTARAALDAIETEAVVEQRRAGASWTEVGVQMGITRQAARERFLKVDPQGDTAA